MYRDNLDLINSVIGCVSRMMHLSVEDREDFVSAAHLKLIDDDYAVLRKFQGSSSLKTYLVIVIKRFSIDFRNQRWGRWRASVLAKRLGDVAVALETLICRDGLPFSEASSILVAKHLATESEVEDLLVQLPVRFERKFESDEGLETLPGPGPTPLDLMRKAERVNRQQEIVEATRELSDKLDDLDQVILRMSFEDSVTVADMAKILGLDQRRLYTVRARILRGLRKSLEEMGFGRRDVAELFGDG